MEVLCDATKCSCYTNYTMYKLLIGLGAFIGGIAGAYIPALWGDNEMFGIMSILLSTVGAIVGIILGYNLAKRIAS